MWTRKATARASERGLLRPDRRHFLGGALVLLAGLAAPKLRAETRSSASLPGETRTALGKSGFVYVSPLRSDATESTCHGEVWFGWLDGAVVLITSRSSWKARSLAQGLDRARLWVGDHGTWKRLLGRNEAFRAAPHFEARAEVVREEALLERLMAVYTEKYPAEFPRWEQRMRTGFASGERLLLRYRPLPRG